MQSSTIYRQIQRRVWPPCFDVLQTVTAGNVDQLTARDRFMCNRSEINFAGSAIFPADFFKIRSMSLQYRIPPGVMPVGQNWTVRVTGRNFGLITNYPGPEGPEPTENGDQQLTRVQYYQLPPSQTFQFSLRTTF